MYELKTINRLWKFLISMCVLIGVLSLYFPSSERSSEVNLLIFCLTGFVFFLLWFLLGVLAFSKITPLIVSSMPKSYTNRNFKYLFFLKIITTKKAFKEIQEINNQTNFQGDEK